MNKRYAIVFIMLIVLSIGCKKENDPVEGDSFPEIISLTADKYQIQVGGQDPAILTCEAAGGGLMYAWEVDLGDIFALNESGSQVRFTGSECCVGDKLIKCTVTNDLGSVTDTVIVHIFIP